jgi:hypothetical protein
MELSVNSIKKQEISKKNGEYERYLNSEIYGSDVATLINKAISSNESNNVQKDDNNYYINNNENSITIDLVMITNEEKQETTVYKMEAISKVGITEFIKNFNTAKFECTKKEYHKLTGKIAHIEISQKIINY